MKTSRANADPSGRILLGLFALISAELRRYAKQADPLFALLKMGR
jgi:hypothetical protein